MPDNTVAHSLRRLVADIAFHELPTRDIVPKQAKLLLYYIDAYLGLNTVLQNAIANPNCAKFGNWLCTMSAAWAFLLAGRPYGTKYAVEDPEIALEEELVCMHAFFLTLVPHKTADWCLANYGEAIKDRTQQMGLATRRSDLLSLRKSFNAICREHDFKLTSGEMATLKLHAQLVVSAKDKTLMEPAIMLFAAYFLEIREKYRRMPAKAT